MKLTVDHLRQAGHKITSSRKMIWNALAQTPLSALEIHGILKDKGLEVDLVTIYRSLDLFINLGLINKTRLDDKTARYELKDQDHHHHLICQTCKKIKDISFNEANWIKRIEKESEFTINNHQLEFFGLCKRCQ